MTTATLDRPAPAPTPASSPAPGVAPAPTLGQVLDLVADPSSPNRFSATVGEAWTVVHVHGGVLVALAARMAEVTRPSAAHLLTGVHALFLRPVPAGPVTGEVTWLRAGRSAAQANVDLLDADGQLAARVLVVTAERRPEAPAGGSTPRPSTALDVAAAREALGPLGGSNGSALPFQQRHTWLSAVPGHAWDDPAPVGDPGRTFDTWFRLHDTPTDADGGVDPLVLCLAADAIGLAATEALDLWTSERHLILPTLEMNLQLLATPVSGWILQHAEIHHVADGLVAGSVHLFDEADRLVGLATQRAAVRFF